MNLPIACITGATSGIGKSTAIKFAENKFNLIITGRRKDRLDALCEELKYKYQVKVMPVCFDVRNREEVENALNSLNPEWKNIDVLVNNAGLAVGLNPIHEGVYEDWERMIDTNIKGLLYVTRTISPWMVARKKGHIINVGSIAGKEAYANGNVYCATKFAVDALTKTMRIDLVSSNVKVSQIAPGAIETEFSLVRFKGDQERADNVYKGFEPLHPKDVANVIYFMASLPPHVNINDLVIMPTAQANSTVFYKV